MPTTKLRALQMGEEPDWGDGATATVKLMGITDITFKPNPEIEQTEELGSLAPSTQTDLQYIDAEGNVKGWVSYEDFPYYLEQIFGKVTPTGAAGAYVRSYEAPTDEPPDPRLSAFEYNQTGYVYDIAGALLSTFQIDIESKKYWVFDANYLAKSMSVGTLAALAGRACQPIRAADTKLYIDDFGDAIGTTEVPADQVKMTLNIDTHRHLKDFIGSITPPDWGIDQFSGELTIQFELGPTSKALIDALIAPGQVEKLFRIKATSGAKVAQIDFAGVQTAPDAFFDDRNGNQVVTLHFMGKVDLGPFAQWLKVMVTNAVAVLA